MGILFIIAADTNHFVELVNNITVLKFPVASQDANSLYPLDA